jgi:hypothetical protein
MSVNNRRINYVDAAIDPHYPIDPKALGASYKRVHKYTTAADSGIPLTTTPDWIPPYQQDIKRAKKMLSRPFVDDPREKMLISDTARLTPTPAMVYIQPTYAAAENSPGNKNFNGRVFSPVDLAFENPFDSEEGSVWRQYPSRPDKFHGDKNSGGKTPNKRRRTKRRHTKTKRATRGKK